MGDMYFESTAMILTLITVGKLGYDKIDLEAAKAKSVYVCNNRAVNAVSVAEHAILLMLACIKKLAYADAKIKEGKFNEVFREYQVKGHTELGGKTVGLIGLGAIGKAVTKYLDAFGCKLLYTDVIRCDKEFEEKYNLKYTDYDELYEKCDILPDAKQPFEIKAERITIEEQFLLEF